MDNVTVTTARNYDHYRIGVVSVYVMTGIFA